MITRKAILISNPGEKGAGDYCKGVDLDIESYDRFLRTPFGGSWYDDEIMWLARPTQSEVIKTLQNLAQYDYSLIVFIGHSWYSRTHSSAILELRRNERVDSKDLRMGSGKRTIILDCCRSAENQILPFEESVAKSAVPGQPPNPSNCRKYYDEWIEQCSLGVIIAHSCDNEETAGGDCKRGGHYSYNLIRNAVEWAECSMEEISNSYKVLSVPSLHERTLPAVKKVSGGLQNPQIEKPVSERHFPFVIAA